MELKNYSKIKKPEITITLI